MKYELFEILSNLEKLREFRKENVSNIVYKLITNNPAWFYYGNGIYDVDKQFESSSFILDLIPIKDRIILPFKDSNYSHVIREFIDHGLTNSSTVKAIRHGGINKFLFFDSVGLFKKDKYYSYSPVLEISEDIYNLCMIQLRNFNAITKNDLSEYSSYFNISEEPYKLVSDDSMRVLYKKGNISLEQYKKMRESYEREVQLVKTLRK